MPDTDKERCNIKWCETRHDSDEKAIKAQFDRIDTKFDEIDKRGALAMKVVTVRMDAGDRALILAETGLKDHLDRLNHSFDRDLERQTHYLTVERYEDKHDEICKRISDVEDDLILFNARYERRVTWSVITAIIAAVTSMIMLITRFLPNSPWEKVLHP